MSILLFDGGNSRFKWAVVRDGRIGAQRAVGRDAFGDFAKWLARAASLERIVGVNVGGATLEQALRRALRANGQPRPEFLTSSSEAAGVRNAYAVPARLGADRWAAAVAAWHGAGCYRTVCAVSIGTALTLDLVDQEGRHRGGLITPGPGLMRSALLGNTADIADRAARAARGSRRRGAPARVPPLAIDTRQAVDEGSFAAAAGFIDRTVNQLTRRLNVRPVVFVTGGASAPVIERLRSACRPVDDLVLRGVAAIADVTIRRRA